MDQNEDHNENLASKTSICTIMTIRSTMCLKVDRSQSGSTGIARFKMKQSENRSLHNLEDDPDGKSPTILMEGLKDQTC